MPDYMYLLESRLSPEQRAALMRVQELARAQDSNIYLVGGAVRDLISGMPMRDLDFTVEGNPLRILHELEKGGARVVSADEHLRHYEIIFVGDVDGSLSAARDEFYPRPGAKAEMRWSTIMEDLRRRDFSINAIAISLNLASRGLLLDPTNGLADLERREIRTLSIHAFTNQPIRLLRALRFAARMGFKLEARTQEWFDLAMERGLQETLRGRVLGREILDLGREENPVAVLKLWDAHSLLGVIHHKLPRRRPDYEGLVRLARARAMLASAGIRVRAAIPVIHYLLGRMKSREASAALRNLEIPAVETAKLLHLPQEATRLLKLLRGRKTNTPRAAYDLLAKVPTDLLVFVLAEFPNPRVLSKVRNYLRKWRPLRLRLPVVELDSLGIHRGAKFEKILEELFDLQLRGKYRAPQEQTKLLRRLAGIKEEPKPKLKEEKKSKPKTKGKTSGEIAGTKVQEKERPAAEAAVVQPLSQMPAGKPVDHRAAEYKPASALRAQELKEASAKRKAARGKKASPLRPTKKRSPR